MQLKAEEDPSKEYVGTLSSRHYTITSQMDQKMRGPRPTEGRVNRSYRSEGALNYRRSGHPDVTYNYYNSSSFTSPNALPVYTPIEVYV